MEQDHVAVNQIDPGVGWRELPQHARQRHTILKPTRLRRRQQKSSRVLCHSQEFGADPSAGTR
jgi:hypothetical protein